MPLDAPQSARFTVRLFGIFGLSSQDTDIPLRGRKACALIAYLALVQTHRATREHLAGLLWTDRGTDQARASLRQTLGELRAVAEMQAALAIERSDIALAPESFESDLQHILEACDAGALATLGRALAAIQGALLESLGDVSPAFDEWAAIERVARLEQIVAQSLACVERHGMTRPEDALTVLRLLDRLDPANEGVARLGMRLDHAAGDSAALHRRYRRLTHQLQEDFGAAPAEATRSLFQTLTRDREPLPDPGAQGLPRDRPRDLPRDRPRDRPAGKAGVDEFVPAVVVAPLQVLGAAGLTADQAEFCSDDMRLAVASLNGFKVLAADSADIADLLENSADCLALYLLSGKVHDPGTGAVAMLQLANARDRTILWSQRVPLSDGADPCAMLVAKAVGALQPCIDRDLERLLRSSPDDTADERTQYARARVMLRSAVDLAETRRAVDALERIVEGNPRHLGARLLLGRMYNTDFWQRITGHDVRALRDRAAEHLEAAAGLAPGRVDVRVRRAWVLLRQGAFDAAARDFNAVLAERQLDPDILNQVGFGLCHLGELARAEAVIQQAFELNPFPSSDYHADYAVILALLGKAEDAEDHFLVSGETGLQYDAVRVANFAALPVQPMSAAGVEARFARNFIAAWQGESAPRPADVLAWVGDTLPLRLAEHRQFVTAGLESRFPEFWPAS